jgi:hypothetical protein
MVLLNLEGLQDDIDAMVACLRSKKGKKLSKKDRAVFRRWLKRSEIARDRAFTGIS